MEKYSVINLTNDYLSALRAFAQAAQSSSFSEAAERLDITASAVGKSVARLEARLRVRLFNRTTRSMSLTEDGKLFFEACQRAFDELASVEARFATQSDTPAGKLRISLPELLGRVVVAPMLFELGRRYPLLRIEISFSNRHTDLIEEHLDLAVRIGNLSASSDLVARRLGVQTIVNCASPDYLATRGIPLDISDLSRHNCITYARAEGPANWLFAKPDGTVSRHAVPSSFSVSDYQVMSAAVLEGLGVAQLPTWLVAQHIREGKLIPVLLDCAPPNLPIQAVWQRPQVMARRLRVLIDALVSRFREFG